MSIKSILVPITGDKKSNNSISAAFSIAKIFNAHVECLHISPDPESITYANVGMAGISLGSLIDDIKQSNKIHLEEAEELFSKNAQKYNAKIYNHIMKCTEISASFLSETGDIETLLPNKGRLSDLIIINSIDNSNEFNYETTMIPAIFSTGRPVMIIPQKHKEFKIKNAVIAWKDSIESARAVSCAIPFLKHAENVHIIIVREHDEDNTNAGRDLSLYLRAHNIEANVIVIGKDTHKTGKTISKKAKELDADLLIMGAFSHSRLRQMIMGGVTNFILEHTEIPVLLSH